jgi:hypothetical protein
VVRFLVWVISAVLKPKVLLVAENLCLGQQLLVLQRRHPQPRLRDLRQSMVGWLAQFAPYCEARNGAEVASTRLACLLVLALKSQAPEDW